MISDDLTLNTPVPARTPNLDLLRASGVSFPHTYAQLCSCAPSRVAIFTSLRPDQTGGWTNAREDKVRFLEPPASPYTLLPQAFRDNGYYVRAYGKLLHRGRRAAGASIEILRSVDAYLRSPEPFRFYHDNRTVRGGVTKAELERTTGDVDLAPFDAGQTAEGISVPDDAYEDGWYGDNAAAWVRDWPANAAPFFLCIGFWRPHIPFNAPKMYWDYYGAAEVAAAIPDRYDGMRQMPRGTLSFTAPAAAELLLHGQDFSSTEQEFIPRTPFGLGNGVPNSTMCGDPPMTCWMRPTPLLADARNLLHGYLASVGKLFHALEGSAHGANTVTVFTSDHGYHLGDRGGFWTKHTNFEAAARVPLFIAAPWLPEPGTEAAGVAELIDIYPTLVAMVERKAPGTISVLPSQRLAGTSLLPTLLDPRVPSKGVAYTQFQKRVRTLGPERGEPAKLPNMGGANSKRGANGMGYSVRVRDAGRDYRYTEWWRTADLDAIVAPTIAEDNKTNVNMAWCANPANASTCVAGPAVRELYYYEGASLIETVNAIGTVTAEMAAPLSDGANHNGLGDGWRRCFGQATPLSTPGLAADLTCLVSGLPSKLLRSSCFSASSGCELGSREASNEYLNGSPSSSRYCEPIASRAAGSLIESAANARLGAISSFTKTRWPPSSSTKSPGGTAIASAKRTLIRRSFGSASTAPPALVRSEAVSSSRYALPIGAASALGASASPGRSTATAVSGAPPTNGSQTAPCPAPPALPPRRALSGSATRPAPAALVASSTRQRGGSGSGALRFPGQCGARAGAWLDGSGTGVVLSRLASQPGIAA
ncbi:hypothetical protein EMIHUDRAFT_222320 [Emiliania huxleyi CCMP1516]|uniref:Sulfatase N-terminal domain-containing protein n=2 Tax=Emiliania huxleyi TaxID=2903 RepID=A0A0D3KYS8_EMIH1|nr:hypothetical protein EMIHUDRAFT_222320 [Emiliania huxleyi CCMP1516]EOD40913.1 hypothetical protein EMIHUDRAFT_222320 [Emiliania huxleyi CCMP1516]|eukprot:XP_005793342.1 hypothetical protein EMIHUDRAFT_222320 [Emiliania huxleyi CCMP1516]